MYLIEINNEKSGENKVIIESHKQRNIVDITYINQGLFTAFIPLSKAGEDAFREICKVQGDHTGKVLTIHAKQTITQLRKAGFKVGKASKQKAMTSDELDNLLSELEE